MGLKRTVVPLLLPATLLGPAAGDAGATLRVQQHIDPAGDATAIDYRLESPTWSSSPFPFTLSGTDDRSFGVPAGTYTAQALLPAGWQAVDIQCVGPRPEAIRPDVANARVTLDHTIVDEHTCAFTLRRVRAGDTGAAPTGVAPSPPASELPKVVLPDRPQVLRITPGRRSAAATVRLVRRAVVKARLQTRRGRVLTAMRIERGAGTYTLRVRLSRQDARRLSRRGRREAVTLTFRIVVIERGGATRVFRHGVLVQL
jgi:hypothetical protein